MVVERDEEEGGGDRRRVMWRWWIGEASVGDGGLRLSFKKLWVGVFSWGRCERCGVGMS